MKIGSLYANRTISRKIFGRAAGASVLLSVAFVGGVTFNDLRGVHNMDSLRTMVSLVPQRLSDALVTAAHGQTEAYTPYETYADVLTTLKAGYYGKDIDTRPR